MCAQAINILKNDGIQLFEISNGFQNVKTMSRCAQPKKFEGPKEQIELYNTFFAGSDTGFEYKEGYNVEYANVIRKKNPDVPLAICGGLRDLKFMNNLVFANQCEIVSLGRPFIRDQNLVARFYEGKISVAECASCNQCFLKTGAYNVCKFPK